MPFQHRRLHEALGRSPQEAEGDNGPVVVVKTVFQTLEPTFKGAVAGYKTLRKDDAAPSQPTEAAPKDEVVNRDQLAGDTAIPTVIEKPKTTGAGTVLAEASGAPSGTASVKVAGEDHFTTAAAADPTSSSSTSTSNDEAATGGLTTGATAGIVFGVLGGLLLLGLLIFFIFSRRKKQAEQQRRNRDDEKLHGPMAGGPTIIENLSRSDPKAPRISLRPVTQFFPTWNTERRSSKGAAIALSPSAANGRSAWDRPSTSQSMHPNNPFGNQAERAPSPVVEEHNMYDRSLPPTPMGEVERSPFDDPMTANGPAIVTTAGAGASALSRKTSMRRDGPKKLDLTLTAPMSTVPASPAGTEFSMNSDTPGSAGGAVTSGAAAIAAAGGPSNSAVHRVQLDFKPTLEDEMGLRAGDLVRLLHEYDDGWALCIRLDRSQQGVVPRTCLSTRPVKPRAPQNGARPGPPVNPTGRRPGPSYAQGQRSVTPQGHGRSESPMRPRTATGPRPASPAGRSMSPSGMNRPVNAPGPSPMNPAQAPFSALPPGQAY